MLGAFINKYKVAIIITTVIVCAISLYLMPTLKTEVNFKYFFPKGEPELRSYETFVQRMGSSDNTMVIAIEHKPNVFDSSFLVKADSFEKQLKSISGIRGVMSILSLQKYKELLPGTFQRRPYLQAFHPERYSKDSLILFQDSLVTQHFITKDGSVLKLIVRMQDSLSLKEINLLISHIDTAASRSGFTTIHFLGQKFMESEYKKIVSKELRSSILLSLLFVTLILALLHRSVSGVLIPLLCMVVSLIMLYGYLAIFNRPLTIMSNLFPTIVLIVGISDVIHISSKFAYESRQLQDSSLAISKTLKEIGLVTFINSATTAGGFLTLLTVSMQALQSFGIEAAVGLLIAWINSIALLPALLLQFNLSKSFSRPVESAKWNQVLTAALESTKKYPKTIIAVLSIILVTSLAGISLINTNNRVLTSLPLNNRLYKDYTYFDKNLDGGRTFEMMITSGKNNRLNEQHSITEIEKLEDHLLKTGVIKRIISPVTLYKWLNHVVDGSPEWQLPVSQDDYTRLSSYVASIENNIAVKILDSSSVMGRLYGRAEDIGRDKMGDFYNETYKWINANIDTSAIRFSLTGADYITDIGHKIRIENMTQSFLIEVLFVSLVIGLIYRSVLLLLISFIANMIPVVITGGIMGFMGFELRGTTTIVFAIGYVIAVDATLHFINRFILERKLRKNTDEALAHTYYYTGRAMAMTSLILLGGFLILLHSSFGDVFVHGVLMSLIILTSLLTELFFTPILIRSFYKYF